MKHTLAFFSLLTPLYLASAFVVGAPSKDVARAEAMSRRQATANNTANDLVDGVCGEIMIIFARGTFEAGNIGTLVGPPLLQAVGKLVGASNVAMQGVDYPADIFGFLEGGDPAGSQLMSQLIAQAVTQCPSTKLVISGYSQGGQLVHNAAKVLTPAQTAFISSAVIFGDPDNGTAVGAIPSSKTLIICHTGDDICEQGFLVLPQHLTYGQDAGQAATFIVQAAGLS